MAIRKIAYICGQKGEEAMYIVPLTPGEIWLGIALFVIVVVVIAIKKSVTGPRRPTDEESEAYRKRCEEENAKLNEHIDKVLAEHEAEVRRIMGE